MAAGLDCVWTETIRFAQRRVSYFGLRRDEELLCPTSRLRDCSFGLAMVGFVGPRFGVAVAGEEWRAERNGGRWEEVVGWNEMQ